MATPVLAGRVVDAIVDGDDVGVVVRLAVLIAVIAVAEAGLGLLDPLAVGHASARALILDLRTAVFDHVQRMPIAFFTRTRTGALVSRLNNDVIGAQRAFSDTLSGVVGNLVTLVLTLVVMLGISWQITLLALVLLPVFVLPGAADGHPAGPAGARGGQPQRGDEHPDDRAVLRAGRDAGQAVRPAGATSRPSSPRGPGGCATSACARRWCSGSSSPR